MKKFLSLFATLCIIFSIIPTQAHAAPSESKVYYSYQGTWSSFQNSYGYTRWQFWKTGDYYIQDGWISDNNDWYFISVYEMNDPGTQRTWRGLEDPWIEIMNANYHYRWFLFAPGGKLVKKEGWEQTSEGKWIYWIPGVYGLATSESLVINGTTYYFDYNGYMQ